MSTQAEQRQQRQQEQIKKDQEQAAKQQVQISQPAGGINQPQYKAGAKPTWSDSPAGEQLRKEYEKSGVVFDSGGRIIYNPADMGAGAVETARAAAGLPPSARTTGEVSKEYAYSVYQASQGAISELRSTQQQLDAERGNVTAKVQQTRDQVQTLKQRISEIRPGTSAFTETYPGLVEQLRSAESDLRSYQSSLQRIDSARQDVATKTQKAQAARTQSLINLADTTKGPVPVRNALGAKAKPVAEATPQRPRVQAQTGVPDKLFANPSFMQDAENYTRLTLYQDDVRVDRLKILTGQPDSKYANPDFLTFDQQQAKADAKPESRKNYFINLEESPQLYTIDFGDGKKLEGLTSAQVAEYQKTFELGRKLYELKEKQYYSDLGKYAKDLKTQGVKEVPVLTQGKTVFVPVQNLVSEMRKISAKDPQARITQFVSLSESLDVRESPIMQTKIEQGPTGKKTFTVATPPPTPPKYELMSFIPLSVTDKPGELRGIGTFKEQGQGLVTVSTPEQLEQYRTTEAREEFNRLLKQVERETLEAGERGDILGQITGEVKKDILSGTAAIQNIFAKYAVEPVEEFKYQQSSIPFASLYTPQTLTGVATVGVVASGEKLLPLTPLGPILKPQSTLQPKNATEVIAEAGIEAAQTFETEVVQKGQSYIETYGPATVIGALAGGLVIGPPATKVLKVVPLRFGSLPAYTKQGEVIAQKTLAFGVDTRNIPLISKYGVYGGGKFKLGKIDYEKTGVREFEGIPGSSFDRFQPTNYSPFQQSMFKRIQKYAEERGITPAGYVEKVEPTSIQQRDVMPSIGFEYEKQVPGYVMPAVPGYTGTNIQGETKIAEAVESLARKAKLPEEKVQALKTEYLTGRVKEIQETARPTYNIFAGVGKVIRQKFTEPAKGSIIYKMLSGGLSRPVGDFVDIEAKSLEKGEKAVASLLKTKVPEGYALEREGYNIAIGEADPERAFFDIKLAKGEIAHGTDLEAALQIQKYGADPTQRPYGMPAFFATEDASIFANFASGSKAPRVVVGRIKDPVDLLEYKNIPKRERKRIIDTSFEMEKRYGIPQWAGYQELLAEYATKRGYKAVTKPYKGLTPDAPKFETIVLEKGVFEAERIVEPSRYGIKEGTGEKIINIVTEKEEIKNIGNLDTSKVYGKSYPSKKIKYEIPGDKEKFATLTMEYQYQAKLASTGGIESRASLKGEGLSDEAIDQIMGDYQFVRGGKGRRFVKDVMDKYLGEREAARVQFQKGDRAGALKSAAAMRATQEYYGKMFDFGKAFREYRLEVDTAPPIKGESLLEKTSGSVAKGTARASPRTIPPTGEREQEKRGTVSARVGSASASARMSPRVSARVSPGMSTSTSASISARTSPAQLSVYGSTKSASVRSSASPSSARSASPASAKSPSIRSPSPKSLFSPKPRSPLSPKSGSTPSPKMTSTPSPGITSGPSPLITSPPSPRVTSSPSPIIRPDLDILIPKPPPRAAIPFVKQKTDKEREKAEKERADFIGQAKVSEIVGFGRRGDITYGRTLTAKLAGRDVRESGRRSGSFVRSRSFTLLDRTNPAILKKDKKEKEFKL